MSEIRRNIAFSAVSHAILIAMAVAANSRDAAFYIPANYLSVSLLEYAAESAPEVSWDKKGGRGMNEAGSYITAMKQTGLFDIAITQTETATHAKAEDAGSAPLPHSGIQMNAAQSGGVSSEMPHAAGTAPNIAGGAEIETAGMAGKGVHKGDTGHLHALIRAAIEKAKTYPFIARKKKIEGTVITEFMINSRGLPEDINIRKSSGSGILDSAALNIISMAAPFPAISGHIVIPITFSLINAESSPLPQ